MEGDQPWFVEQSDPGWVLSKVNRAAPFSIRLRFTFAPIVAVDLNKHPREVVRLHAQARLKKAKQLQNASYPEHSAISNRDQ